MHMFLNLYTVSHYVSTFTANIYHSFIIQCFNIFKYNMPVSYNTMKCILAHSLKWFYKMVYLVFIILYWLS